MHWPMVTKGNTGMLKESDSGWEEKGSLLYNLHKLHRSGSGYR